MSLDDSVDRLYEAAQGSMRIRLLEGSPEGEFHVNISGKRTLFEFLAKGVSDLLEAADCKFSVAPFGAGCGWFGRNLERDTEGWYLAGPTEVQAGGLFVHLQPCVSDTVFFPNGRGLGWMCFVGTF